MFRMSICGHTMPNPMRSHCRRIGKLVRNGFIVSLILVSALISTQVAAQSSPESFQWRKLATFDALADDLKQSAPANTVSPYRERAGLFLSMFSAGNAVAPRYEQFFSELAASEGDPEIVSALAGIKFLELVYPHAEDRIRELETCILRSAAPLKRPEYQQIASRSARVSLERITATTGPIPDYTPFASPGAYVPTAIPRTNSIAQVLVPFVLPSVASLRPAGPPSLDSNAYSEDFSEVAALGRRTGSSRTQYQTTEAVLWIEFKAWEWFPELLDRTDADLLDQSRMALLFQMALFDGKVAMIDSKAHFQFWRPITAIRRAELDGRNETKPDTAWLPLLKTPNHSEYLSGHCQEAATSAFVLNALFPVDKDVQLSAPLKDYSPRMKNDLREAQFDLSLVDGVTTTVQSFAEFRDRKCDARIYAGAHFRTTNEHSIALGEAAAHAVLEAVARPINANATR